MLCLLVMLSLKGFSQTDIQTDKVDTTKVVLSVRVARLVYQDLLRYDGLKEETGLLKLKLQKTEERELQKDDVISLLTKKDENNQFIIVKKDEQIKLYQELSDKLNKELKAQRTKTFLWKLGTFVGAVFGSSAALQRGATFLRAFVENLSIRTWFFCGGCLCWCLCWCLCYCLFWCLCYR